METNDFSEYTEAFNKAFEESFSDTEGEVDISYVFNEEKGFYNTILGPAPQKDIEIDIENESNLSDILVSKSVYGRNVPSQESKNIAQEKLKNTKINIVDDSLFINPSILSDENLKQIRQGDQRQITVDKNWIKASKLLHNYLKPNEAPYDSDEEYAKWGIDFTNAINYSITDLVVNVNKMDDAPPQLFHAMYYLLETSDRQGISLKNFAKGVYEVATDPVDQLSLLGGFGVGFLFKQAGQQVTKRTLKQKLKDIIVRKPNATDLMVSAEVGAIVGTDSATRQKVRESAGQGESSILETGLAAATGAVLGPVVGRGIEGLTTTVSSALKKLKPKKDAESFMNNFKEQLDLFVDEKPKKNTKG